MKFSSVMWLSLGLAPVFALTAPWQRTDASVSTSPWGAEQRKQSREAFFGSFGKRSDILGGPLQAEEAPAEQKVPVAANEKVSPISPSQRVLRSTAPKKVQRVRTDEEMSDIPWNEHREKFPLEEFEQTLLWPVIGSRLTSGYGIRGGRFHEGLDLAAPKGTPIHAIADGRIVFSGRIRGYGKTVVIYHGEGVTSIYAHNNINLGRVGSKIKRGAIIDRVGRTGHAFGSHCHFEMRLDGKPTNPLSYTFQQSPFLAQN